MGCLADSGHGRRTPQYNGAHGEDDEGADDGRLEERRDGRSHGHLVLSWRVRVHSTPHVGPECLTTFGRLATLPLRRGVYSPG
eukprot:19666-Prymnesium_polylepis.1